MLRVQFLLLLPLQLLPELLLLSRMNAISTPPSPPAAAVIAPSPAASPITYFTVSSLGLAGLSKYTLYP